MPDITMLLNTGSSAKRVDIAFVAEGYTAQERSKFISDAQKFIESMLGSANATLNSPFSNYKNYFNASALFVASNQSGIDQPNQNIYVDTYFDVTQHGDDGRLLYGDEAKVSALVQQSLAQNAHEMTIVLVNTNIYGGAGGSLGWAAAGSSSSSELILHEVGHSYAHLQDEYADPYLAPNLPLPYVLNSAHLTDNKNVIPWSDWLGFVDGLGKVATYEGGLYRDTGIWRATQNSKMLSLGTAYNAPEKEAFALQYYADIGDYLDPVSSIPGLYMVSTPDDALMRFNWTAGAANLPVNSANIHSTYYDALAAGTYTAGQTITVTSVDNTGLIRKGLATTQQSENFVMKAIPQLPDTQNLTIDQASSIYRLNAADNQILISDTKTVHDVYIDGGAGIDTLQINAMLNTTSVSRLNTGTVLIATEKTPVFAANAIEKLKFNDFTINLSVQQKAQTVSVAQLHKLEELYVAYFNRVPEADGLEYWIGRLQSGMSLQQIGDSFYDAALKYSAQTGYSTSLSNTDFINIIYKNVLGRAEGADPSGLNYWLQDLNAGNSRGSMVATIIQSAHQYKGDVQWGWVADLLDNKVAVADQFAVNWGLNYSSNELSITNTMAISQAITAQSTAAALSLIGISHVPELHV